MKKLILFTMCLVIPSMSIAEVAPPAKEMTCRACHGAGGAVPLAPSYPKLNGQNKEYLVGALQSYRAGQRQGGLAASMSASVSWAA